MAVTHSKEDIKDCYKKLKASLGHPPSSAEFTKETGIRGRHLESFFGSDAYSKLVIECGDTPNKFFSQKSNIKEILIQWGTLAKNLGKVPTGGDWRYNKYKPTIEGIRKSHDLTWTDVPYRFLEMFSDYEEWQDVIALIPIRDQNQSIIPTRKIEGLNYEQFKFIPPVVHDLISLSVDEERSRDFEKNVNLIFQMLGFDVAGYGQGTGRNPDGIAKENQYHYSILIDAKARRENYKIGTEDRKFIEYIKTHSESLKKAGFSKIYFLIVSSQFESLSETAIKNIKIETQVNTTLLSARLLLKLLAIKIKTPRLFDLKAFQELLIEDGEISEQKIDKIFTKK